MRGNYNQKNSLNFISKVNTLGSNQISKNGSTHHKKPKFICKSCRRQFIENPQKKYVKEEEKSLVEKLLLERISLRGISRSVGVSLTWLQKFVNNLYRSVPCFIEVSVKAGLEIILECDELWSYVNSKENPIYIWLAIERNTKLILGFHLGDRTKASAAEFWQTIPETHQNNAKFYTDLWESYQDIIPEDRHCPSDKKVVKLLEYKGLIILSDNGGQD